MAAGNKCTLLSQPQPPERCFFSLQILQISPSPFSCCSRNPGPAQRAGPRWVRAAACHVGCCTARRLGAWGCADPIEPPSWAVLTPLNPPPLPPAASNPLEAPACARLDLLPELCVLGQLKNLPRRGRGAGGDLCSGYFPGLAGVYGLNSPVTSPSAFSRSKGWGFECLKTAGFC